MAYHTSVYLFLFLPLVLFSYQIAPRKIKWLVLLGYSYLFFYLTSGKLLIFLVGTTALIYCVGVCLEWLKVKCKEESEGEESLKRSEIKNKYKKKEKAVLSAGIILLLAVLIYLKYYNFFAQNANLLLQASGGQPAFEMKRLLLPVGISFYTLQAIGYIADVYWEKIPAEKNFGKLALFMGFFPQIMEGPICSYQDTANDLWKCEPLEAENLARGGIRIVWGLFKKMIIADRLAILVGVVFKHYGNYSGVIVAVAAIAYTVQLYMEFSGSMDIIIGSGRLFGVRLPENFRQPFASKNAAEFWRRWHITLGVWFKTYVFYPVSVSSIVKKWNKYGKKHMGKHMGKHITKVGVSAMALFPVWLGNGLWHGARWSYIFYGMYYFVILLFGVAVEPVRKKIIDTFHIDENALYWKIPRILKTWVIIFTGELFFRADGLLAGLRMFCSIFQDFNLARLNDGTMLSMGLDRGDYLAVFAGCLIVFIVGVMKEKQIDVGESLSGLHLPVRWAIYYALILAVIIFGAYGAGYQQIDLIYAGF